jgi:DNA-directed RNA polymerase subunit beta
VKGYKTTVNDLIDADTGKVVLEAGKKLVVRTARQLAEKGLKFLRRPTKTWSASISPRTWSTVKTGEIYAEAGEEITEKSLKALTDKGSRRLPVLDIDHINIGPYIRNTLKATRT